MNLKCIAIHRWPRMQKWYVGKVEKQYGSKGGAVITVGRQIADILGEELRRKDVKRPVQQSSPSNPARVTCAMLISPCQIRQPLVVYVGKLLLAGASAKFFPCCAI